MDGGTYGRAARETMALRMFETEATSESPVKVSTYARRQLNPFRGVLQIIETDRARAFSANGILWQIQTLAIRPDNTWRTAGEAPAVEQYFNWGLWSSKEGTRQVIANPILDIGAMESAAADLIEALTPRLDQMPFSLGDRYELWACDGQANPVALLKSATSEQSTRVIKHITWKACAHDENGFVSPSLDSTDWQNAPDCSPRRHADYLESQARDRTETNRWFRRYADGRGVPIDGGSVLTAQTFPVFGISERWNDSLTQQAFEDFVSWNAPLLLTLSMPDEKRAPLEQQATQRPVLVDDLHRLYPVVTNPKLIEQIRIQAHLLRSQ